MNDPFFQTLAEILPPGQMPTWETIERLSLHDTVLHEAMTRVSQGTLTQEQALLRAVVTLTRLHHEAHKREVRRLMTSTSPLRPIGVGNR